MNADNSEPESLHKAHKKVCVTGSTGLVGSALVTSLLRDGVNVTCLVRDRAQVGPGQVYWDPAKDTLDARELEGIDAVVHLAGAGIADGRWTKARKQLLVESRVRSTALLATAIASCERKPSVLVSASGVGFYGNQPDNAVDEQSPKGEGFLADVCAKWEAATVPASEAGVRVVRARFGLVMSLAGGALPKMLKPIRAGVGGHLGTGKQFVPWVTLHDAVSALRFAIAEPTLAGAVNVVAPEPCTNREMTLKIAKACGRRTLMPVPAFALRVGLGEMAEELLLSGANVRPRVLERAGFRFDDPRLEDALSELLQGATAA
jgi:uncharacterized protein